MDLHRSGLREGPITDALPRIEDVVRRDVLASALAVTLFILRGDEFISGAAEDTTKTITNEFGTYEIPVNPQRLLLMGNRLDLEIACALGLSPIAIGRENDFRGGAVDYVAPWVPFDPSAVESVFDLSSPDVEMVLALNPDMIFAAKRRLEPDWIDFATLSAVAPVIPTDMLPWREDLQQVAGWLGRQDRLDQAFREFGDLQEAITVRHGGSIARARVVIGNFEAPNTLWLVEPEAIGVPARDALTALGGQQHPLDLGPSEFAGWSSISMENLRLIEDADAILIWAADEDQRAELLAHPLWKMLPAVEDGRAIVSTNNLGYGSIYTIMECMRLWDEVYALLE
jgi:iron complex transport system substrate-binding protein